MKIAIITAGGAGMFCGSCMQDNTMARALRMVGQDAVLVPTYTPIRVDEENVSADRVFLGGINVYLDSVVPGWMRLPGWLTHWLNRPSLISALAKFGNNTDASKLGALTLDMLKGNAGPQHREVLEFVDYLCDELKPDIIIFSNALLSGVLSELRPRYAGRILCLLQGDDIFLEDLTPRWKESVLQQMRENCQSFDGFLTHSRYYKDFMVKYLNLPREKFRQIPLTIEGLTAQEEASAATATDNGRFRIGYFARICPQKGINNFLTAASEILPRDPQVEFAIGGFLPGQHRKWFERLLKQTQASFPNRIHWLGSPAERTEKLRMISTFDVMCVPTDYHEPKGIYVLEAGLAGVRSILPHHGAFPEVIESLGSGTTYSPTGISEVVDSLLSERRRDQARDPSLPQRVEAMFGMRSSGTKITEVLESFVSA